MCLTANISDEREDILLHFELWKEPKGYRIERQTKYLSKVLTLETMRRREQRRAFSSRPKDGDPGLCLPPLAGVSCVSEKTA